MRQAWLVNPYDIDGMKSALLEAYAADQKETGRRMRAMRKTVVANDVSKWARDFLEELRTLPEHHDKTVRRPRSG